MIIQIQYLRAVAAMSVVVFHVFHQLAFMSNSQPPILAGLGASGVDLFFVISGFVMWVTTADGRVTTREFYARRILRIAPLYWAVTLSVVAVMVVAPRLLANSKFDLSHILASLIFIPWLHPISTDKFFPVVIPGWTLNYEMFFYGLFGLFLFANRPIRLLGMTVLLGTLVALGIAYPDPHTPFEFYTAPIMLEFVFGMMIGAFYANFPRIPAAIGLFSLCLGVGALVMATGISGLDRVVTSGLPSIAIVFGTLYAWGGGSAAMWRPLYTIGQSSYAIYLTQVITLAVCRTAWHLTALPVTGGWAIMFVPSSLAAAVLCGIMVHDWIEKPLSRLVRRNSKTSTPHVAMAKILASRPHP